jgi:surface polysaccharide O-acyltransferase-like enzyme
MEANFKNDIKLNEINLSIVKIYNNNYREIQSNEINEKKIINRNNGIDLLKIISMINIIVLHINLFSRKLTLKIINPRNKIAWKIEAISYWSVNCFGMISGIVGYKGYKMSNLIYLWFQVTFYSILITLIISFLKKFNVKKRDLFLSFFPILIKRHWYVNAYFSMYLFLPFINNGINSLKKTELRNIIFIFFAFFSLYNIIAVFLDKENYHFLNKGYSSLWLMILYSLGAYLGKNIIINNNKFYLINSILYLLIFLSLSFLNSEVLFKLREINNKNCRILIDYLSPTVIMQAICLIMFFSKLNIKNKKILKIISFIIPLNFSAYLIHAPIFKSNLKIKIILFKMINNLNSNLLLFKIYIISIIIYFICIFIDYIRSLIFKLCQIRKLSLFIEKIIPKLINKLIFI